MKYKITINALLATLFCSVSVSLYAQTNVMPINDIVKRSDETQRFDMMGDDRAQYTVGGSAIEISGDELRRNHHRNLISALAGRVPGLIVTTSDSEPGSESYSMNMRGYGDAPIVLIDGTIGSVESININDVESVTIIKDASAALYGMQAPGGIIAIKTKRGSNSEQIINVSVNYTYQSPLTSVNILGSQDHVNLMTQAYINDGTPDMNPYNADEITGFNSGVSDLFPDNDWYNMFMASKVQTLDVHASAIGGGEYVNYYTSIGYQSQTSPFRISETQEKAFGIDRFDLRSNVDFKINSFISGKANVYARVNRNIYTSDDDGNAGILSAIFKASPTDMGPLTPSGGDYYPSGAVVVTDNNMTPAYALINRVGYTQETDIDLITDVGLDVDLSMITKGLSAYASLAYTGNYVSQLVGTSNFSRYRVDETNYPSLLLFEVVDDELYTDTPLSLTKASTSANSQEVKGGIAYDRVFNDKHWFKTNIFARYNNDKESDITAVYPVKRMTFASQTTYGYKDLLYVDYIASYQGSEQFAEGNRYGFFNTGSVSYVVSNMDFLKNSNVITYLRARASYGTVGSDNFGDDRFLYADNYTAGEGTRYNNYLSKALLLTALGNPLLTWETSTIANIGVDVTFFDKFTFSAEYYRNRKSDILITEETTPGIFGVSDDAISMVNAGITQINGIELQAGYVGKIGNDVTIGANGYFSYFRDEVEYCGELPREGYLYTYTSTGFRSNQLWGYEIDYSNGNGYFNSEQEIFDSGLEYTGTQPRAGDFIYVDQNGDYIIDSNDMVPMGDTTTPQINWGAEIFVQYKNFDLSALFQGSGKWGEFNSGIGYYENKNQGIFFERHLTAWTAEAYANGETITGPALTMSGSSSQTNNSYWYQDKSYGRLKNLEIGYSLSNDIVKKLNMHQLRVYVSATNLFTWDKLDSDDRDIQSSVNSFPIYRYWNMGVNLTF